MKHLFLLLSTLFILFMVILVSCQDNDEHTALSTKEFDQVLAKQFLQNYAAIVYTSYRGYRLSKIR